MTTGCCINLMVTEGDNIRIKNNKDKDDNKKKCVE